MAIGDTARLIASLELKDLFTGQLNKAEKSLGHFDSSLSKTQSRSFRAGQQIGTGIKRGAVLAAGGIAFLAANVAAGVQSLEEVEKVTAQTNAVLKSTKGVSGQTAQGIRDLATGFESLNATMDDTAIQAGANVLLTFTNIREKAFKPTLQAALDISTAMGQDLQSSVVQLGKALNDPAKGLTALTRIGVTFTAQQKKQIESLEKQGKTFEAQKVILAELNREFGGSFLAQGNTTAGKVAKFKDAVDDLQRALAKALLPAIGRVADALSSFLGRQDVQNRIEDLGKSIADLFSEQNLQQGAKLLQTAFETFQTAAPILEEAAKASLGFIKAGVDIFNTLPDPIKALAVGGFALNKITGGLVTNIGGALLDLVGKSRGASPANPVFVSAVGGLPGAAGGAGGGLGTLAKVALVGEAVGLVAAVIGVQQAVSASNSQIATGIGESVKNEIAGGASLADLQKSLDAVNTGINDIQANPLNVLVAGDALDQLKAQRDLLSKQIGLLSSSPSPGTNQVRPGAILDRGGREQGFSNVAALIKVGNVHLVAIKATGERERRAIEDLKHSSDPKKIADALKAVQDIMIKAGHGSVKATLDTARAIRDQLKHTHDPTLQTALRAALKAVEGKIPGREYAQRQLAKADRIIASNKPIDQKLRDLNAIQKDLANHKLPGQTATLRARIDALKASQAAKQDATTNAIKHIPSPDINVTATSPNVFIGPTKVAAALSRYIHYGGKTAI